MTHKGNLVLTSFCSLLLVLLVFCDSYAAAPSTGVKEIKDPIYQSCSLPDVNLQGVKREGNGLVFHEDVFEFQCYNSLYVVNYQKEYSEDGLQAVVVEDSFESVCNNGIFENVRTCAPTCNLKKINTLIYDVAANFILPGESIEVFCKEGFSTLFGLDSFFITCGDYGNFTMQKCIDKKTMCYDSKIDAFVKEGTVEKCNDQNFICSKGLFEPAEDFTCNQSCDLSGLRKRGFRPEHDVALPESSIPTLCPTGYSGSDGTRNGKISCSADGVYSHDCTKNDGAHLAGCGVQDQISLFDNVVTVESSGASDAILDGGNIEVKCRDGYFFKDNPLQLTKLLECEGGIITGDISCQPKCDFSKVISMGYEMIPLVTLVPYDDSNKVHYSDIVEIICPAGYEKSRDDGKSFIVICKEDGLIDFDLCYLASDR